MGAKNLFKFEWSDDGCFLKRKSWPQNYFGFVRNFEFYFFIYLFENWDLLKQRL